MIGRALGTVLLAAGAIGVTACIAKTDNKSEPAPAQPIQTKRMSPTEFLDLVSRVAAQRPYTSKSVAEVTGIELAVSSSNEYFDIYTAKAPIAPFTSIEVRQRSLSSSQAGQVMFELAPDLCVTETAAVAKLGAFVDEGPSIPSPHGPPGAPAYRTWKIDGVVVKLGFARDTAGCARIVIITTD